jgi:hypothetical protein
MSPQGVTDSPVALGFTDGLVGLQVVSGVLGGLMESWVAMAGRGLPLGVAFYLGESRVTLITCQIFTNAPKFRFL